MSCMEKDKGVDRTSQSHDEGIISPSDGDTHSKAKFLGENLWVSSKVHGAHLVAIDYE